MKCPKCQSEAASDSPFCSQCGTRIERVEDGALFATRSITAPSNLHQPGRLVGGRYKLLSVAGHGGMGVVFKAEDTKLLRTVALKFLPEEISRDPEAKKRFLREAQAAAILDHPNICPVYEVDESEGEMFLTMAFIEGRSLKERIAEGPLPLIEVLNVAVQVAEGLKAAHEKGVVHRDIKPANIMLNREGQVRITDFGLASVEGGADLTRPQTVLGTAVYMSPEQVRGEKTDGRTDIWSFGCTLFEMTTGRRPFVGEHGQAVRNEILNEAAPKPSSLRADIPAGLEEVILRCLRKSAADRFPDFESLLAALQGEKVRRPSAAGERAPLPEALPSVAVLPFVDMSPAKDQDYFGEGLAEEIIHALARLQGIRVVARTSAFALKSMKLDMREIGKMLDVRAVVEGSVRKAGSRLRVTAQLIDARTGLHLWSERFDREERDVFDIQDEISLAIVEHLKVTLLAGEKNRLRKRPTADTEAYNLYLKGLYFVARPNRESLEKAMGFFRQALDRDPDFAQAHAGIAFVFAAMGAINLAPQTEVFPKARAALEQALAVDPESALAHSAAASVQYYFDLDWAAAEKSFRRVIELDPSDSMSRGQYAWLLLSLRRFDEALAEIKRAMTIDPLMPILYAWSVGIHGAAGRTDEALEDFSKLLQIDPTIGLAYFHAAMAYYRKGLFNEAIEILQKGAQHVSFPGWGEDVLLLCRLKQGDRAGAEKIQADMLEARKTLPVSAVTLAYGFAGLGDLDSAFEWLETAIRDKDSVITVFNVYTEFLLPELARDPRFGALLDRLHLPA
jgi:TolB-like protein/Tfp pilus assembly protein PilF/tRNA A-37 threonylcarbamoyl transferase component Bud32